MGEIRQANFRVDTDSADAFRAYCEERGWNQAQGFDHLLQVLELQNARTAVPERALEFDDFDAHLRSIMAAYVHSVSLAEDTEDRVRGEFMRRMESKDETIEKLQIELKAANAKVAEAAEGQLKLFALQGDYAQATADIASLEDRLAMLQRHADEIDASKLELEKLLSGQVQAAQQRADAAEKACAQAQTAAQELRAESSRLVDELKETKRESEMQAERAKNAAEKAQDAAVAAVREVLGKEVEELKTALTAAQIAAERELRQVEKDAAAEIRRLEKQVSDLQLQLQKSAKKKESKDDAAV